MNEQEVIDYLKSLPTPVAYDELTESDKVKQIFNAHEEVSDVLIPYENVKINKRMVALQTLYNIEGEEEGIAMLRRQGITDYTVKDVKAVLNKDVICPAVLALIGNLNALSQADNAYRVGRLI